MTSQHFVGIHREARFVGPNHRQSNGDHKICARVAEKIEEAGYEVDLFENTDAAVAHCVNLKASDPSSRITIFTMCRDLGNLRSLVNLRATVPGITIVDDPAVTLSMSRKYQYTRMQALRTPMPDTWILSPKQVHEAVQDIPVPAWIKLAGAHHIDDIGVEWAETKTDLLRAATRLSEHSLKHGQDAKIILQADIPDGVETKFYGVTDPDMTKMLFFGAVRPMAAPNMQVLEQSTLALARDLGVTVFGGDCIVRKSQLFVVDFNCWPSFRPFLEEGAEAITSRILQEAIRMDFKEVSCSNE